MACSASWPREALALFFPGDSPLSRLARVHRAVDRNDIHDSMKSMTENEAGALFGSIPPGAFARFNGSPFYMTKVPDLIGIKDRKYIDHTGTHRLRDSADVMRYAALVSCCDMADFGPHRILTDAQRRSSTECPTLCCSRWPIPLRPRAAAESERGRSTRCCRT